MPSLYTQKSESIRKTWILFTVFFVIVIGVGWVFSQAYGNPGILYFAVLFSVGMNIIGYWYSDKIVLSMAHAKPVDMQMNAFATGRDPKHAVVAVTEGLLRNLTKPELEGVLAHEMSHVGNRDMLVGTAAVILVGFISIISDMF